MKTNGQEIVRRLSDIDDDDEDNNDDGKRGR